MKCDVLTLFPDVITAYLNESILKRARENNLLDVCILNIRDFTTDVHRTVDDYPYGGGAGMVFKPEPIFSAIEYLEKDGQARKVILLSPQGNPFDQRKAESFAGETRRLTFICGRYEGVDERVKHLVDEEVSIGDYVMTGGELAALVIIDAVTRLIPGAVGDERSVEDESFSSGLLEYPQYTRPREFRNMTVPDVLLSGNHEEIRRWRRKQALRTTLKVRPDMLDRIKLDESDKKLIVEISSEENN
ncbi:MAG: tRNA (guanosine(37)-N1)-methyltransferase TrmD [Nitrospiraceae bacterium]|nr:MAG: tRNA (guanosine(37)-N1)-methyltransferase TrmD [Nitrospiraceae bacterium]